MLIQNCLYVCGNKNSDLRNFFIYRVAKIVSKCSFQICGRKFASHSERIVPRRAFQSCKSVRRMGHWRHAPSRRLSKLMADETSIEFSEIISYMQQCFDPVVSTYVHAYCVITNALSRCMCNVKYGRFIMETKALLLDRLIINANNTNCMLMKDFVGNNDQKMGKKALSFLNTLETIYPFEMSKRACVSWNKNVSKYLWDIYGYFIWNFAKRV